MTSTGKGAVGEAGSQGRGGGQRACQREQTLHACATEARFRQLQGCNTTGIDVGKAASDLRPKGTREQ